MKPTEALMGAAVGIVSGLVLAQFVDLIPAIVIAVITGVSVAFAARTATGRPEG
ncbi:hypothetical protein ABDK96_09130 [Citricoccus nitrophenolicus]|uniref:Glycine zipper family protein n=1 Tax=Citricoccus nitrophenolicus TaxID=863575 RepID=A0ABV0IJZ2_9MICC|nr:hypothetical protein [Citricoccus sp. I39-566]NUL46913.1 hypothetical protein [Cellulosimicrobium funkei]WMY77939.1 hypothetical protein RE421_14095 [Citricoccus sp. I39-566]